MGFHSDFQKTRARPLTLHGQSSRIEALNCIHLKMLFGRERMGGKDSHSRQWRLNMAAFLNRNKRP